MQTTTPIVVSGSTLPTLAAVILRYAVALLGTYLVSKGIVDEESIEGIATLVITAATVAYGIWKTRQTKAQLVVAAEAAPSSVARVK